MKHKIYSLLLVVFLLCAASTIVVGAATNEGTVISKTVKVNKKVKLKKTLKLKNIKDYTFTSNKKAVAAVSNKGVITAKKAGKAVITVKSKVDGSTVGTVNVKVKNRYTKKQLRLMSALIFAEAGNQSYAGKKAVGIVVMNRVKSSSFPNTLKGVIYQPYQFSPARNGALNRALNLYDNGSINKDCIKAAKATLNGDTYVSLNGKNINMSTYLFFSGYVSGCRLEIGGHQFK